MQIGKFLIILLLHVVFTKTALPQIFTGQVLDSKTRQPLAYVNIGIPAQGLGIMTDEEGRYTLPLDPEFSKDTLHFSIVGYKAAAIPVSNYITAYAAPNSAFLLQVKTYSLSEVIIRPKKGKTDSMGNTIKKTGGQNCVAIIDLLDSTVTKAQNDTSTSKKRKRNSKAFEEKHLEVGTLFEIKKKFAFIEKIQIQFCDATFDSVKLRLNIYSDLEDRKVKGIFKVFTKYTNILKSPIYFTVWKNTTLLEIDLSSYNIGVSDDFIVTFETLRTEDNKKVKIPLEMSFGGEPMVIHFSNGTPFMKFPMAKIGFSATISY